MNIDIFNTDKKYKTIYMDPPWAEQGGGKIKRGADKHYPLMKTKDIAKLPIRELADPDGCHIYMWVTNNFLEDGLWLLEQWGFEYITMITWMKGKISIDEYLKINFKKEMADKEDFIELYSYGFTSVEIARAAGCCDWTVRDYLKKHGVKMRNSHKKQNIEELDQYQKEIIDGEMLGDGHIALPPGNVNAYMDWHFKRLGHILFLYDSLSQLEPNYTKRTDIGDREGWRLWTQCNPYLTEQYHRWYKNGVKIVPKDIELTPTVCFHWYIGDGSYEKSGIKLYSCGFTYEENEMLANKLRALGFKTNIHKKQYPSGEKYCLYIRHESVPAFLEYIGSPESVPCYAYKWGLNEDDVNQTDLSHFDNCGLGQYYRGLTEHCIFARTKQKLPYKLNENGKRCQGVTGFIEPKREHSRKPDKMRKMIEEVSHGPRIELFARESFDGWDCWGLEAPSDNDN